MKTRNIVGQRIVHVEQQMINPGHGYARTISVIWLELEDGTRLMPKVGEGEAEYHVDFVINRTQCKRAKPKQKNSKPCSATIWHGPGHQSSTKCELVGPHKVHQATYGSLEQVAQWRGKKKFTGCFDEPPTL